MSAATHLRTSSRPACGAQSARQTAQAREVTCPRCRRTRSYAAARSTQWHADLKRCLFPAL